MRVIAGQYGSRPLKSVPGKGTRPTTDKVKENMFNLIGPFFSGGVALDFYAGSGALGIEAVSRGMDHAVLIDQSRAAVKTMEENVAMTWESEKFTILSGNNRQVLQRHLDSLNDFSGFQLVFLDPPYDKEKLASDIEWLDNRGYLSDSVQIICEMAEDHSLDKLPPSFICIKEKQYGLSKLCVISKEQ